MKTRPVRIRDDDWDWLMHNRGVGSLPDKVHELLELAKEAEIHKEFRNTTCIDCDRQNDSMCEMTVQQIYNCSLFWME